MNAKHIPVTVIEVVDMLISGREKLANELVKELQYAEKYRQIQKYRR